MTAQLVSGALVAASIAGCCGSVAAATLAPRTALWGLGGSAALLCAGVAVGLAGRVGLL